MLFFFLLRHNGQPCEIVSSFTSVDLMRKYHIIKYKYGKHMMIFLVWLRQNLPADLHIWSKVICSEKYSTFLICFYYNFCQGSFSQPVPTN